MKKILWGVIFVLSISICTGSFAQGLSSSKDVLPFTDHDTLDDLRFKIEYNGYHFTVDHNWVFDMSPEEKADFFSMHASKTPMVVSDDMGPLARQIGKDLPASFDWRNVGGHTYIGPVRNQGSCGSCYAFGACAAAEGAYNKATGSYDGNCLDLSESFIIWCLSTLPAYSSHFSGCDGSDYEYQQLEAICQDGIILESYFPYTQSDPGCSHWSDPRIYFDSWYRIPCSDITAIKTAIYTYGVVNAVVYVDSAFEAYSGGVFENSSTSCSASPCYYTTVNHAIALVGWDDNPPEGGGGVWILRNSWGAYSWGENGYMRIRYTSARVSCAAAYVVYSNTNPTVTPANPTSTPATPPPPTSTSAPATSTATPVGPTSSPQPTNSPNPPTDTPNAPTTTPPPPTASSTPATGPATPTNTPEPPCRHTGDVDANGNVTAGDAQLTFQIALGQYSPTQVEECAADCNNSGTVTAGDAQQIFQTALGSASCSDFLKISTKRSFVSQREIAGKIQVHSGNTIRLDTHSSGDTWTVSVDIAVRDKPVDAITFDIQYVPEAVRYASYDLGDLDPGWILFDCREVEPGLLRIAGFSNGSAIDADMTGTLVDLKFEPTSDVVKAESIKISKLLDDLRVFSIVD